MCVPPTRIILLDQKNECWRDWGVRKERRIAFVLLNYKLSSAIGYTFRFRHMADTLILAPMRRQDADTSDSLRHRSRAIAVKEAHCLRAGVDPSGSDGGPRHGDLHLRVVRCRGRSGDVARPVGGCPSVLSFTHIVIGCLGQRFPGEYEVSHTAKSHP